MQKLSEMNRVQLKQQLVQKMTDYKEAILRREWLRDSVPSELASNRLDDEIITIERDIITLVLSVYDMGKAKKK